MRFTVVIPTFGRPEALGKCLDSLSRLRYPEHLFEVVVVDDGGPAPIDAVVDAHRGRLNVRSLRIENSGPGPARNAAAEVARGRYLAFTDDDCWPSPDWLCRLDARFETAPDSLIGGRTINRLLENPYSNASQAVVDAFYAFFNADPSRATLFASNNIAVPTAAFRAIGGFNVAFRIASEDRDLCERWISSGRSMIYAPEAIIAHGHDLTLRSFCRQHFQYGRGGGQYYQDRKRSQDQDFNRSLGFHSRLPTLFRDALLRLERWQSLKVVPLLFVWFFCNSSGFFYETFRTKIRRFRLVEGRG